MWVCDAPQLQHSHQRNGGLRQQHCQPTVHVCQVWRQRGLKNCTCGFGAIKSKTAGTPQEQWCHCICSWKCWGNCGHVARAPDDKLITCVRGQHPNDRQNEAAAVASTRSGVPSSDLMGCPNTLCEVCGANLSQTLKVAHAHMPLSLHTMQPYPQLLHAIFPHSPLPVFGLASKAAKLGRP
jgi:hypothetical protein